MNSFLWLVSFFGVVWLAERTDRARRPWGMLLAVPGALFLTWLAATMLANYTGVTL